jgi:hypothetical protein
VIVRVDCYQVEGTESLRVVEGIDSPSVEAPTSVLHEGKGEEVLLTWNIRSILKAPTG